MISLKFFSKVPSIRVFRPSSISWFGLLLLAVSYNSAIQAQTSLELDNDLLTKNTYTHLVYFEDKGSSASINQILLESFQPVPSSINGNLSFGYSTSSYWVKLKLENRSLFDEWILEVGYPLLDEVEFFLVQNNEVVTHYITGDQFEFSKRPIEHRNFLFPVKLNSKQAATIYLRIKSSSSVRAPVILWQANEFAKSDQSRLLGQGLYFGILVIMLLYNLFIYFSIKERAYIHYVFYVASYIVVQASLNGLGYQFVFADWIAINDKAIVLGLALVILFGCSFTVNFLNLKYNHQQAYRLISLVGLCGGLSFILAVFLPYAYSIKITLLLAVLGALLITGFGLLLWLKHEVREAKFFSIAWVGFLSASLLMMLNRVQLLPDNWLTENAAQIGSAFEVMLLSFALADKFSQMRGEKERIEVSAKKSLSQVNALLVETLKRLESSNKIKSDFLATVSHELRTPMNGIIGANELLRAALLSDEAKDYLSISESSSQQMMELITSMLQFVEVQAGMSDVKKELIDLQCLVYELETQLKDKVGNKHVELVFRMPELDTIELYTDYQKLFTILEILTDNAIKYTHSGRVEVEILTTGQGVLEDILFVITDTGIGIEKQHIENIFDAFSQVDTSTRRPYGGLGMGLTVARLLANVLGGNIEAVSVIGKGSQFTLSVPLYYIAES